VYVNALLAALNMRGYLRRSFDDVGSGDSALRPTVRMASCFFASCRQLAKQGHGASFGNLVFKQELSVDLTVAGHV
jgi:hypothetical protein